MKSIPPMIRKSLIVTILIFSYISLPAKNHISIENDILSISWIETGSGWKLDKTIVQTKDKKIIRNNGSARQTIIFSTTEPIYKSHEKFFTKQGDSFPESFFKYPTQAWNDNISEVSLNTYGEHEITNDARLISMHPLTFESCNKSGTIISTWIPEKNSIKVKQIFKAHKTGFYGVSTPFVFVSEPDDIQKAVIPGYLTTNEQNSDFVAAYGYGYYIPDKPVIYRDRCATTPVVIISENDFSVAITAEADYPRKPYSISGNTHSEWCLGLSLMNSQHQLSPGLYYPVPGQQRSFLHAGEEVTFEYRFMISESDWYSLFKQTVYEVLQFNKQKRIAINQQSLTDRVFQMYHYLKNKESSRFRIAEDNGTLIGAQDYLGGVAGSDKDAMKNSDYGAMWMLAHLTEDEYLKNEVLPYARNFKIKQVYETDRSHSGAVKGQYFLWKSKQWVEEWGKHIEPIGVMYYALADMGNILLFNPNDDLIRQKFKLSAEYLLNKQKKDGSWDLGYDKSTQNILFPDLKDLRPTFYGMLIAFNILKEQKYLDAAVHGANWFIENAVSTGKFTGVCGDTRFAPDFATSQSVQALLDIFRATGDLRYKQAAVKAAQIYTTYIYTYPNGLTEIQNQKKQHLPAWAFSQSGLCFEHAGTIGSANSRGPILLASHAGMFVRMFQLTHDSLFIDMARVAANGKDAFVDKSTGVASYYWDSFDAGAGSFPHHAWWQIGWIMDYLVSEAELRSKGRISFPRGFITPKVGPHQSIGFAEGSIDGKKAKLILIPGLVQTDNPQCDYLTIKSDSTLYVLAMNSSAQKTSTTVTVHTQKGISEFENINLEAYALKILEVKN